MMENMGVKLDQLPQLYHFDLANGPKLYKGALNEDDIRVWGQDIIKYGQMPAHMRNDGPLYDFSPGEVVDPSLA